MKTLYVNGETYQAERIIRTNTDILGFNSTSPTTPIFAFRQIKDWTQFQLAEGQEWDIDEKVSETAYLLDLDFRISMIELGV